MNGINNYSTNSNINFTAKMDITQIKGNAKRWKNIAKMFEEKTAQYTEDVFEVMQNKEHPTRISFYQYADNESALEHCADLTQKQSNDFFKNSDETIVEKLTKLFSIFKRQDEDYALGQKFIDEFRKGKIAEDTTNFEEKFWDAVVSQSIDDTRRAVQADSFFKGCSTY